MDRHSRAISNSENSLNNEALAALFFGLFYYFYFFTRPIAPRNALSL